MILPVVSRPERFLVTGRTSTTNILNVWLERISELTVDVSWLQILYLSTTTYLTISNQTRNYSATPERFRPLWGVIIYTFFNMKVPKLGVMAVHPTRAETLSAILIIVLTSISSALGLFRDGHYADATDHLPRIYAQDAVLLMIGVPILAIGLWFTIRGSLRGRIVWLGSLTFMVYMWTHYAFVIAYNDFFLGYVALFGFSIFTLVSGLLRTDPVLYFERLHDVVSTWIYAGFLGVAAAGLGFMWLFDIVPAVLAGELPSAIAQLGPEAAHTYVIDLAILVPCLAMAGVWLRQQRPWGYVLAGVLLVFAALIAPALTAITAIDLIGGLEISVPILIGTILPPLIGLVFAGTFLSMLSSETGG